MGMFQDEWLSLSVYTSPVYNSVEKIGLLDGLENRNVLFLHWSVSMKCVKSVL